MAPLPSPKASLSSIGTLALCTRRSPSSSPATTRMLLEDSLASYTRALEVDPEFSDAFSSIGYFHDVVMGDLAAANLPFARLLRAGYPQEAIVGLARVLTQLSHPRHEVAALLDSAIDPMSARVNQIRAEINDDGTRSWVAQSNWRSGARAARVRRLPLTPSRAPADA